MAALEGSAPTPSSAVPVSTTASPSASPSPFAAASPSPSSSAASARRGARVLVIEDEDAIRAALAAAFRLAGHTVRALVDGADLEAEVDAFRPDLALLDVMVPGRDGFELTRVLRGRTDAVVLLLTARDELA